MDDFLAKYGPEANQERVVSEDALRSKVMGMFTRLGGLRKRADPS